MTDLTPWNDPRSFDATDDESECVEDMLGAISHYEKLARQAVRKANWKRRVKAFCIAVAVFCIVYFGGRELLAVVS